MRAATDLKERILAQAGVLFCEQGYLRTTNKQIADAVGSTTAALYYYFPEGKKQLLREVAVANFSDVADLLASAKSAQSLPELLQQLGVTALEKIPSLTAKMNWFHAEFPQFDPDDQAFVRQQLLGIHEGLRSLLARFIVDDTSASHMAWFLIASVMGHYLLFDKIGMAQLDPGFDRQHMFAAAMRSVGLPR